MTKQQFIDAIAAKSGLTKADSSRAVEAFIETVTNTLKKGDKVTFNWIRCIQRIKKSC